MSNYTKATNFATKDALPTGNALKIVSGTEIDTEFSNIETAVNTKADTSAMTAADALKANIASPTFTGVPAAPTATAGTNTTQVATTEFVKAAADAVDQRMAKAWVSFNGTGTVAINSSYGVSSLTDINSNNTEVNFSTAFANTSYCLTTNAAYITTNPADHNASAIPISTTKCLVEVYDSATIVADSGYVSVVAFAN